MPKDQLRALERELSSEKAAGPDRDRCKDERRAKGAFFTPAPLVRFVVDRVLAARVASAAPAMRSDGTPRLRVLDPAAGDGRFLAAAADWLARYAAGFSDAPAAALRSAVVRRCLFGVERDPRFADAARAALPGARIVTDEALLSADVPPVDAVISNPPYVRSIRLGETDDDLRTALRGKFAATSFGEWDLYGAFIERSLSWLARGGEAGLITPSRWLTAAFAGPLREYLAGQRAVRGIVDFGAVQVFDGATTYASITFLSRHPQPTVEVARRGPSRWSSGAVDAATLGRAPWKLSVGDRKALVERLAASQTTLGDIARIVKGAGTNADRVFVSDAPPDLELSLLRRCLRGRDIAPFGDTCAAPWILVPYTRDGEFIEPGAMARDYPRALAHLRGHRDILERRERGRFAGDRFYCFGRPQNMAFFGDGAAKVVIPDVARSGRALVDRTGAMVLDSAYALRLAGASGYTLSDIAAVLNSAAVELWLRETGVVLRGGYLRLKTNYLRTMPMPPLGSLRRSLRGIRRVGSQRERIDDAVRRAYGVSEAQWATPLPPLRASRSRRPRRDCVG